ncbi:MAG: bb3-type cytochrome oxidase subunit III [candidate division GAL15 bacterium]
MFVWLAVVAVGMFFLGLTSALLSRMASAGWTPVPRPAVLWPGTAALLVSSVLLEASRRALARGGWARGRACLRWGALSAGLFLACQVSAWRWLASSGVGLAASPGASYFYVLSGAHLVHALGGLAGWAVVARRASLAPVSILAVYWHFLTAVWVWLFAVLFNP